MLLVGLRMVPATPESLFFGVATAKSVGVDIFHVPVPRPVYTVKSTLFFQVCLCVVTGVGARLVQKRYCQLFLTSRLFCATMFIVAGVKGHGRAHFNLYSAIVRVPSNT